MEEYAKIIKNLGDRKMTLLLPDTTEILGVIPGRFRKRCWIMVGDVVLISKRQFQQEKVDIIYKYNQDEVKILGKENQIPISFTLNTDHSFVDQSDSDLFIYGNEEEEENDEEDQNYNKYLQKTKEYNIIISDSESDSDEYKNIQLKDI